MNNLRLVVLLLVVTVISCPLLNFCSPQVVPPAPVTPVTLTPTAIVTAVTVTPTLTSSPTPTISPTLTETLVPPSPTPTFTVEPSITPSPTLTTVAKPLPTTGSSTPNDPTNLIILGIYVLASGIYLPQLFKDVNENKEEA